MLVAPQNPIERVKRYKPNRKHVLSPAHGPRGAIWLFQNTAYQFRDLVTKQKESSLVNSPSIGIQGMVMSGTAGATDNGAFITNSILSDVGSYYCRFKADGVANVFSWLMTDSVDRSLLSCYFHDGDNKFVTNPGFSDIGVFDVFDGLWHDFFYVWDAPNNLRRVYLDKVQLAEVTDAFTYTANNKLRIGSRPLDNRYAMVGIFQHAAFWDRRFLSLAQANLISNDFYNVCVEPINNIIPFPVESAGGTQPTNEYYNRLLAS